MSAPTANELHVNHFPMLWLAKVRGLTAKRIGDGVYTVPSHTRKQDGILWVVTFPGLTCSCPAARLPYCSHRATAVDRYFTVEGTGFELSEYTKALMDARLALRLRIRSGETTKNDRTYLRFCERFYRDKLAKAAAVVPPITETVVREGGRTRTITRCGSFTI